MKVEFKAGDIINIPNGCKAVIKDGSVFFKKEFKDGDVLHSIHDSLMLIYKECSSSECFNSHFNTLHNHNIGWNIHSFRHATVEEKQRFFAKIKERGLHWNAVEKRVEKFRERVPRGNRYLYVDHRGEIISVIDFYDFYDNDRFKVGNYYLPEDIEEAKLAAKAIKAIYQKRFIAKP